MPATKTSTTKTVLGKRKTRQPPQQQPGEKGEQAPPSPASSPSDPVSEEDAQAILRRHFEACFKPLSPSHVSANLESATTRTEDLRSDDSEDDDDDASEASWSGVSGSGAEDADSEEEEEIEVVSYANNSTPSTRNPSLSKREARAYLSSRVPSSLLASSETQTQKPTKPSSATAADEDAPSLLKNDLALQRLLTESHLFSKSKSKSSNPDENNDSSTTTTTTTTTEHAGRNRHLATDLRLAALGSKRSIFAQRKMPMAMRQGIAGAAAEREARRRREARESGVVLERKAGTGATAAWLRGFGAAGSGSGSGSKKRGSRGGGGGGGGGSGGKAVDAPAVGKLRNGMLTLSKRDVSEIQGSGGGGGGSRGGGGGGGGGGKRRRR